MKNLESLCGWLSAIALVMLTGAPLSSQGLDPGFTSTLTTLSPTGHLGSDVWINIVQKNTSDHAIDCSAVGKNGVDINYDYDVTDADGKPIDKVIRKHSELDAVDYHGCLFAAGDSATRGVPLSRLYKFDRPGKYLIRVSRAVDEHPKFPPGFRTL